MDCSLPGPRLWDFLDKNTKVGCHALLQETCPTQELNLGLLHCRQILYHRASRKDPQVPAIYCQIKLRIIKYGRFQNQERPNLSGLSWEVDRWKGPLLVPRVLFLAELKQRREICSGSLICGHHRIFDLKNVQCESCESNFIWVKMRTMAGETLFQTALRNCSKESGRKVRYM